MNFHIRNQKICNEKEFHTWKIETLNVLFVIKLIHIAHAQKQTARDTGSAASALLPIKIGSMIPF